MSLRPATVAGAMTSEGTWRSLLAPNEGVSLAEQECRPGRPSTADVDSGACCMASCDRETSTSRSATITSIHFTTMSPCELEDQSVTKAAYPKTKDYGGLHDPALGPTARELRQDSVAFANYARGQWRQPCATCGEAENCPGHFGHLKLQAPVFNPVFLEYVKLLLDILCPNCARPVLPLVELAALLRGLKGSKRLRTAAQACRGILLCRGSARRRTGSLSTRARAKGDDRLESREHAKFVQWLGVNSTPEVVTPRALDPEELLLEPCQSKRDVYVIHLDKYSKSRILVCKANNTGRSNHNGNNTNREDINGSLTNDGRSSQQYASNVQHQNRASASKVVELFTRVSDDWYVFLGLNVKRSHPTSWLIRQLPIPPIAIRISNAASHCANGPDATLSGLDAALRSIYLANKKLEEATDKGLHRHVLEVKTATLQDRVNAYIIGKGTQADAKFNKLDRLPLSFNPVLPSIAMRISGYKQDGNCPARLVDGGVTKQGRIRSTVTAKRSDMSARSVISPDPCLAPGEVGIPRSMTRVLTVPEIVTPYNIQRLQRCMEAGPYPATGVVGGNELMVMGEDSSVTRRFHLQRATPLHDLSALLADGHCIAIARHLQDGDLVIINRQPSLHKQSLMAHAVRVLPTSSLHLNPVVCLAYGADFDGDEMNVFVPQSLPARIEAQELLSVNNVLSEKGSEALLSLRQDALLGAYLISAPDTELSTEEFQDLIMGATIDGDGVDAADLIPFDGDLFYGKQALKWLLGDVCYMDQRLDRVEVQSMFARMLQRKVMGRGDVNPVLLAHRLSNMAHAHLARVGFTAGIADILSPSSESNLSALDVMMAAGSAGSARHSKQMREELGQQHGLAGSSFPFSFYPDKAATHPSHTGLVCNSLLKGLSPVEFFWHAAEGRRTICLKQCETATPGYLWKRVSTGMNSLVQAYSRDGTSCVQCVQTGRVVQIIDYAGCGGEDMEDGTERPRSAGVEANQCVGLLAAQAVCSQMQQKLLSAPNKDISDDLCTKTTRLLYLHKAPSGMVSYTVALTPDATIRAAKAVADELRRVCLKQYVSAWELRHVGADDCNDKPWLLHLQMESDALPEAKRIQDLFQLAHLQSDVFQAGITAYKPHRHQEETGHSIDVLCTLASEAERMRGVHKRTRAAIKRMEQDFQAAEDALFVRARELATELLDMTISGFKPVEEACARIENDQVLVEIKCHQPRAASTPRDGALEQCCLLQELHEYCLPARRGLARRIDMLRTQPEDCGETLIALGIEAARAKLMQLLRGVLREADIVVEERHIALIADYMTWHGRLRGFTAAHASEWRGTEGVLATAADEQPLKAIKEAAIFGKVDALTGPNARIALGLPCSGGTGAGFDLLLRSPEHDAWRLATPQPWFEHEAAPSAAEEPNEEDALSDSALPTSPLMPEIDGCQLEQWGSMDPAEVANMDINNDFDFIIDGDVDTGNNKEQPDGHSEDGSGNNGVTDAGIAVQEGDSGVNRHARAEEGAGVAVEEGGSGDNVHERAEEDAGIATAEGDSGDNMHTQAEEDASVAVAEGASGNNMHARAEEDASLAVAEGDSGNNMHARAEEDASSAVAEGDSGNNMHVRAEEDASVAVAEGDSGNNMHARAEEDASVAVAEGDSGNNMHARGEEDASVAVAEGDSVNNMHARAEEDATESATEPATPSSILPPSV